MKFTHLVPLLAIALASQAFAQGKIWRCGNTYTNDEALSRNCRLVEGANVTIVRGTQVNNPAAATNAATTPVVAGSGGTITVNGKDVKVAAAPQSLTSPPNAPRVDAGEQRARDAEARTILEAELKKAETRLGELQKEWNNGEPEKLGPEHRNHQKYLDRVAELKANIARTENDIAGLKRELGRAPTAQAAPQAAPAAK